MSGRQAGAAREKPASVASREGRLAHASVGGCKLGLITQAAGSIPVRLISKKGDET